MYLTPYSNRGRRYRLEEAIGEGRNSVVYKSYDVQNKGKTKPVSVKWFKDAVPAAVKKEFTNLICSFHPHVVEVEDYSLNPAFLVMEYIPETLRDRVVKGTVTQQIVIDYLLQLPEILAGFIQKNIVHGDFKDSNIGYTENRLIKALDFGLTLPLRVMKIKADDFIPLHYPPEFRLSKLLTPGHDTFSAGKVLESILLGHYCRTASDALERMELFYDTKIPIAFKRVYLSLVHPDYRKRPLPDQLRILVKEAVHELDKKCYFKPQQLVPLAQVQELNKSCHQPDAVENHKRPAS